MSRTSWDCPSALHPKVLGPRRPALDHVCRYCLPCSATSTRLVKRIPTTLVAERARREQAKADAEARAEARQAAVARREARRQWRLEAAREAEQERINSPGYRRQPGVEYHVYSTDGVGVQAFDAESFAEALACLRLNANYRLSKVHEEGTVYAAVRSDARIGQSVIRGAVVGWNRVEPPYRGDGVWGITDEERAAQFGNAHTVKYQGTTL